MSRRALSLCLGWARLLSLCAVCAAGTAVDPPRRVGPYDIVEEIPHDVTAFTEGLFVEGDYIYESTGLAGASTLRKIKKRTGEIVAKYTMEAQYFGEGIVAWKDKIYMLTYKARTVMVLDKATLTLVRSQQFDTTTHEGWGMTHDDEYIILSDGSEYLHFWDPDTLQQIKRVRVVGADGQGVRNLNELEYIPSEGVVLANVWFKDYIVAIDRETGAVVRTERTESLFPKMINTNGKSEVNAGRGEVFNGIAYDAVCDDYYFTGKLWSKMFRAKRRHPAPPAGGAAQAPVPAPPAPVPAPPVAGPPRLPDAGYYSPPRAPGKHTQAQAEKESDGSDSIVLLSFLAALAATIAVLGGVTLCLVYSDRSPYSTQLRRFSLRGASGYAAPASLYDDDDDDDEYY